MSCESSPRSEGSPTPRPIIRYREVIGDEISETAEAVHAICETLPSSGQSDEAHPSSLDKRRNWVELTSDPASARGNNKGTPLSSTLLGSLSQNQGHTKGSASQLQGKIIINESTNVVSTAKLQGSSMPANLQVGVSERYVSRKRERERAIERESAREREIARESERDAGIGILFAMQPVQGRLRLVIADIDPGGPAGNCGHIGVGDEIVEVNKRNCSKWTVGEICAQVTGIAGSCAHLLVIRQGSGEKVEVNLKRRGPPPTFLPVCSKRPACVPALNVFSTRERSSDVAETCLDDNSDTDLDSTASPRFHSEYVSTLEGKILDLTQKNLILESELQDTQLNGRQQIFEEESVIIDIFQSSAELYHTIKRVEELAAVGHRFGLLKSENLPTTAGAKKQPAHALSMSERAIYERELAELREASESMHFQLEMRLKQLEREEQEARLWRQRATALEQAAIEQKYHEDEAFFWKKRAEALQGRLTSSDEEYSKLEQRLLNGLSQLREQQEIEILQFKDENEMLRKTFHEGCDELQSAKRQQHIFVECLKEVTVSFHAIGGQEVERLRQEMIALPKSVVQRGLVDANGEVARAVGGCLDDLMEQACILQRHLDNVSSDLRKAQENQGPYFDALKDVQKGLLSLVGRSAGVDGQNDLSYESLMISINHCLEFLHDQARRVGCAVDETEYRATVLEDSLITLANVSTTRAATQNILEERIQVMHEQHQEPKVLDHKAATVERERWQQSIETSSMTIACLTAEIESLHEEKSQMMSSAVEKAKELAEAHSFAEERSRIIKAMEFNFQEYKIEREDLKSELQIWKTQQAQLAREMEEVSVGKNVERDALVQMMTSLELSVESFLVEIESTMTGVQTREAFVNQDLKKKAFDVEVRRLKDEVADKLASKEQISSLQSQIESLSTKVVELEEGNADLFMRLQEQSSQDSPAQQISVLQGIRTRRADYSSLVPAAAVKNSQLENTSECTELRIELHSYRCSLAKEQSKLAQCRDFLAQVIELCVNVDSHLDTSLDVFNAEELPKTIADLQRIQQDLPQLNETRNQEIKVALADVTRYEKIEASLRELVHVRDQKIQQMESESEKFQDAMRELMDALQSERDGHAEKLQASQAISFSLVNSEREIHTRQIQAAVAAIAKLKQDHETTQQENMRLMNAKTKELFELTKMNMILESRATELQRKLADLIISGAEVETEEIKKKFNKARKLNETHMESNALLKDLKGTEVSETRLDLQGINNDLIATKALLEDTEKRLLAKDEELQRTNDDLMATKKLLKDNEQHNLLVKKDLGVAYKSQSLSSKVTDCDMLLCASTAENNILKVEKTHVDCLLFGGLSSVQDLHERCNELTNEQRETQAALLESQLACNRFKLKSTAYAKELHALQQLHIEVNTATLSTGSELLDVPNLQCSPPHAIPETVTSPQAASKNEEGSRSGALSPGSLRSTQQNALKQAEGTHTTISPAPKAQRDLDFDLHSAPLHIPVANYSGTSTSVREIRGDASAIDAIDNIEVHGRHSNFLAWNPVQATEEQRAEDAPEDAPLMRPCQPLRPKTSNLADQDRQVGPRTRPSDSSASVKSWISSVVILPSTAHRQEQGKAGIGVVLTEDFRGDARSTVVLDIIPGMPADLDSNIQVGSRILAVDGVSVEGLFLDAVRDKISGECGSLVTIRYDSIDGNQHVVTLIRSWSLTTPSHGRSDSTSICAASNLVLDTTSGQQLPSRSRSWSPFASERAHDAIMSNTLFFDPTPVRVAFSPEGPRRGTASSSSGSANQTIQNSNSILSPLKGIFERRKEGKNFILF